MYISETMVNVDKKCSYGSEEPYDSYMKTPSEVYRYGLKEHGRCVGRMYSDSGGKTRHIGWIFRKLRRYEDSNVPKSDRRGYYLAECWLAIHTGPDIKTVTQQLADLGAK